MPRQRISWRDTIQQGAIDTSFIKRSRCDFSTLLIATYSIDFLRRPLYTIDCLPLPISS